MASDELPAKLPAPARRALTNAGYTRLEQFTRVSDDELMKLHGVGRKAIGLINDELHDKGWSFADK
jgi:DNA-directed RNA polymerase alpha subunit